MASAEIFSYPVNSLEDSNSFLGNLRSSITDAAWNGYETVKENGWVQKGANKSYSTLNYYIPSANKENLDYYCNDISIKLSQMYENRPQTLTEGRYLLVEKIEEGKNFLGEKLQSGSEAIKGKVGEKISNSTCYIKEGIWTGASHVQSTRVGQVISVGMERAITTVDKAVDYVLPVKEEDSKDDDDDECCDDNDDDDDETKQGVWEHGKVVTVKAGTRITAIAKYRAGAVTGYVGEKYTNGRKNIGNAKNYVTGFFSFNRLGQNFHDSVISTEDAINRYLPPTDLELDINRHVAMGSFGHVVVLTRKVQRRIQSRIYNQIKEAKILSAGVISAINIGSRLGVIENIPLIKDIPLPTAVKERLFKYLGNVVRDDEKKSSNMSELELDSTN